MTISQYATNNTGGSPFTFFGITAHSTLDTRCNQKKTRHPSEAFFIPKGAVFSSDFMGSSEPSS